MKAKITPKPVHVHVTKEKRKARRIVWTFTDNTKGK